MDKNLVNRQFTEEVCRWHADYQIAALQLRMLNSLVLISNFSFALLLLLALHVRGPGSQPNNLRG